MVHQGGHTECLATNTIAQGDTREVGLEQMKRQIGRYTRAISSRKWPGTASLEIAHIWLRQGGWQGIYMLDEKIVEEITPFLTPLTL